MNILFNILRYILDLFLSRKENGKSKDGNDNGENKDKDENKQPEKLLNFSEIKGINRVRDETYEIQSIVNQDKVSAKEYKIWLVI